MKLAVTQCKDEAVKMFIDVLGRKDKADKTRNARLVLNKFRFLFQLPAVPDLPGRGRGGATDEGKHFRYATILLIIFLYR